MESACLRHTDIPSTSRLFADFLYHHDRVRPFYEVDGSPPEFPPERRAAIVSALREQNGDSESLRRLAEPGTVAYLTGQQVGLFSGPAYTIYKALTAVRLAEESTKNGVPAVPIFWLATEDHDFAEVNHAWVFDAQNRPVQMKVNGVQDPDQPVGNIAIGSWPVSQLRSAMAGLPFADEVSDLVEQSYKPGETMGRAFLELLRRVLSKYGLLFVDPLHPAIRKIAAPVLRAAVQHAPRLSELLLARNKELSDVGYHAQVHVEPKTSLFFVLDGHRRIALKRQNGHYVSKDRRYTPDELASEAEHISPNALLRPVVQDYIFPTAAYVGGPAELAYLAQSEVIYREILGYMPQMRPRSGFTLLDARATKLMERYDLRVQDFFYGKEALREKIASRLVPENLKEEFHRATESTEHTIANLFAHVNGFDPTLGAALTKSRSKILHQLTKMEAKVARETMRRNARATEEAAYLYNLLMPHKHLQERFYTILPFLARHGMDLVDRVYEHVQVDCPDHVLLSL
jgi:bacillithiol biosynthesis cysteine-adding enzyme BshC